MKSTSLPSKIDKELKSISKKLGISEEDLFMNALLYYLQILKKEVELKEELDMWEKASNFDLIKFEKKL